MFQSDLLWSSSAFSQIPVWVWLFLSMFLLFLLRSLFSPFQLLKATCLNESIGSGSRNDDESTSEDTEAYSLTDEYDVFLSFRGPDTRQGFTDVLYDTMARAGIRVFRDDDEVSIGQPLQKILHAIETSQICMPIFSRTFAESSWCLREVAKMIELKKLVMPIFYDVKPDDVKLKTRAYRKHLKMHEKKNGKEQVKVWEEALREVARIKGKEVLNTGYIEFCKKLVDEGLRKLKPRERSTDGCLVGIDNQIKSLMELMDIESPDVRYIGIHGMGGIGKTTLAKSLYEKLSPYFDSSCFMGDVRESSSSCNGGLQDLQKQLQVGLDPEFTRGCNSLRDIEERFQRSKVLIVLDDVDKSGQIEKLAGQSSWFGFGSRIIVTTRNADILKKYGSLVQLFEMMTLKDEEALKLFQWYAFREEKPPPILETISRKIVATAGGLPLALQVMGSRLYSIKDESIWRDVLERSREVQDRDVMESLMISYEALEDDQKKIFLDIACFHDIEDKVRSMYMWEASKLYPHLCLAVLSSMSLIKIDDNKIWMHDLLKDLGKGIVRREKNKHGKHSRVWKNEEAMNVLLTKEGQEMVEVLCVDESSDLSLTQGHIVNFPELRFLKMVYTNIEGDFKVFFPKLAWFTWNYCPQTLNITNLYMKNLVVLNLSHSFIGESWDGWSIIQTLSNLKDLDLSYCKNLTRTPDFSETSRLERLKFIGCYELLEIHGSIGKLHRLKYLHLGFCDSLGGFPDEMGRLVSLEELRASRSYHRRKPLIKFKLPKTIGYLKSLVVLELDNLESMDIPDSIGGLVKLKQMNLHTIAKVLPESLGDLKSLIKLNVGAREISELPSSIGRLVNLESLRLHGCSNLEELPESLGSLQGLMNLIIVGGNKIRKIPVSLGKLKKLEDFSFLSLRGVLEELPKEICGLSSLKSLTLEGTSISTLPSTISELPILERLVLEENHQLQELPDLPFSLRYLMVSSKSLKRTPNLSNLVNLIEFRLRSMDDYTWPRQQSLCKVEGFEKLTELDYLDLGVGSAATFDLGSLPHELNHLKLDFQTDCIDSDSLLPLLKEDSQASQLGLTLANLKNPVWLSFYNFLMEEEEDGGGFGIQHLGSVKHIVINNCGVKLIEQICMMKKLKLLNVSNCATLRILPNLSGLENLTVLEINNCKEIVEITGLGNLESLERLDITDCGSLERLENLSKLENLSLLSLSNSPKLTTVEGTERLSFDYLFIDYCGSLQNVEQLKKRSNSGYIRGLIFGELS